MTAFAHDTFCVSRVLANGSPVVTVQGALDSDTSSRFSEELAATIMAYPFSEIFIDLRRATFLDSSALNALLSAQRQCRAIGGELVLLKPFAAIQNVFEVTGVVDRFRFVDDGAIEPRGAN